jgi:hypothetical protein
MSFARWTSILSVGAISLALNSAHAADAAPKAVAKKAAPAKAASAKAESVRASADSSFPAFCSEWGDKLHAREVHNVNSIKWDSGQNWVQGTYVGYSKPLSCAVEPDSGAVPVGKIVYHEFVYEKRGASIAAAEGEPGQAIETTEVTEIFRFQNGKWVY